MFKGYDSFYLFSGVAPIEVNSTVVPKKDIYVKITKLLKKILKKEELLLMNLMLLIF